ncbi:MAG: hypothetical protein ABJA57_05205 [Ginsengibacter sp.]
MKPLFLLLLLPLKILSQDISGIWTGVMHTRDMDLLYELVISENKEKSGGYTLTVYTVDGVDNAGVKSVIIKRKKGNIVIEDDQLIYDNYTTPSKHIKLFAFLSLQNADSVMMLSGKFHTRLLDHRATDINDYSGTISLQKKSRNSETRLISQLDKMHLLNTLAFVEPKSDKEKIFASTLPQKSGVPLPKTGIVNPPPTKMGAIANKPTNNTGMVLKQPSQKPVILKKPPPDVATNKVKPAHKEEPIPVKESRVKAQIPPVSKISEPPVSVKATAEMDKRKTEIIQSIFFTSDSLLISLYDNGIVDGDTVSVVLNGRVIVSKQELSEKAVNVIIHMTPDLGDSVLLTMYAENLGSIPPNTGILIIQDGNARSQIRFEGDLQKSSGIILKRKR